MSYSHKAAKDEQELAIATALQTRDSEALKTLAGQLKGQGDDEHADALLHAARNIDANEWAYDESINN